MTGSPRKEPATVDGRIAAFLLVLASAGIGWSIAASVGWWRAAHAPVQLSQLDEAERERLARSLLEASPGVFEPALFDARVSYTLRPNTRFKAWGSEFTSNELGYRTGPVKKEEGTFRVVFVGDSWTFGLGVDESQAFPRQLQDLANSQSGSRDRVEAWTLALPGYNLLNQTAALESLVDLLEPDAVVFCPTSNDIDSTHAVLANGSLSRRPLPSDDFGGPLPMTFHSLFVGSHLAVDRWHRGFSSITDLQLMLEGQSIPSLVFFTGRWLASVAHYLAVQAAIRSPYLITPKELGGVEWRNPPPHRHPTPEAHSIYARLVYSGLQELVAWEPLKPTSDANARLFPPPKAFSADLANAQAEWKRITGISIPSEFFPGSSPPVQVLGGISPNDGWVGRVGVVLIRRLEDREKLRITVRKLTESHFLYPQRLTVTIPSASGGTRYQHHLRAGSPDVETLTLPIPVEIGDGRAMDVVIELERATLQEGSSQPRSLQILSIEQF